MALPIANDFLYKHSTPRVEQLCAWVGRLRARALPVTTDSAHAGSQGRRDGQGLLDGAFVGQARAAAVVNRQGEREPNRQSWRCHKAQPTTRCVLTQGFEERGQSSGTQILMGFELKLLFCMIMVYK
jgi:hypothetical protein